MAGIVMALSGQAQNDTTAKNNPLPQQDTLKIGNMIIIKNGKQESGAVNAAVRITRRKNDYKPSNISTNWCIFDLGFVNYNDRTDYSSASARQFAPGSNAGWFHLRTIKSVNVDLWFFMQRMNLIKHAVNLKYGLGLELNNYRFEKNIKFLKDPTEVVMDGISYSKNKLAADYLTLPFMLNFNFTPHRKHGLGLSLGASAGYLYSARQKVKSPETGKRKIYGDFDLEPWKLSYIGEMQLGPVRLYGSYAARSMFKKGLDLTPYSFGIRFSNW